MQIPFGTIIPGPASDFPAGAIALFVIAIGIAVFVVILVIRLERDLVRRGLKGLKNETAQAPSAASPPYLASFKADIHPKAWLSRFSQVSIKHLLVMSAFYHVVGIGLMTAGLEIISAVDPSYEEPVIPITLILLILAGPIEETLAFGIPTYLSSGPYVVLATGGLWALAHILNTDTVSASTLAYPTVLFAIPHIFLSLRLWASGKGLFAIVWHSAWNAMAFGIGCAMGDLSCTAIAVDEANVASEMSGYAGSIIVAEVLLLVTYLLYYRKSRKEYAMRYRTVGLSIPTLAVGGYSLGGVQLLKRPTKLYYVAVIVSALISPFLGLIVGVVIFFALRKKAPDMARNIVLIGVVFLIARLILPFW
jgi:hypothetical protein